MRSAELCRFFVVISKLCSIVDLSL